MHFNASTHSTHYILPAKNLTSCELSQTPRFKQNTFDNLDLASISSLFLLHFTFIPPSPTRVDRPPTQAICLWPHGAVPWWAVVALPIISFSNSFHSVWSNYRYLPAEIWSWWLRGGATIGAREYGINVPPGQSVCFDQIVIWLVCITCYQECRNNRPVSMGATNCHQPHSSEFDLWLIAFFNLLGFLFMSKEIHNSYLGLLVSSK